MSEDGYSYRPGTFTLLLKLGLYWTLPKPFAIIYARLAIYSMLLGEFYVSTFLSWNLYLFGFYLRACW